jgi:hypothetical protein
MAAMTSRDESQRNIIPEYPPGPPSTRSRAVGSKYVAQYGVPATPVQSLSLPHAAMQNWFSQNGIVGSVQSVDVVHCGITHVPVALQTCVPAHGVTPESPKLSH